MRRTTRQRPQRENPSTSAQPGSQIKLRPLKVARHRRLDDGEMRRDVEIARGVERGIASLGRVPLRRSQDGEGFLRDYGDTLLNRSIEMAVIRKADALFVGLSVTVIQMLSIWRPLPRQNLLGLRRIGI